MLLSHPEPLPDAQAYRAYYSLCTRRLDKMRQHRIRQQKRTRCHHPALFI
ncbi:hypothetical protein HMPREF9539_04429 [Escherichia coli MS 110-3]|nr:hypothetical protein HMPREF9539_04429 [Escherichia coli MS 110-3]